MTSTIYVISFTVDETTWTFEWNVTKDYFNESEAVPFVTLTATDTMNASTEYRPTIYYCNCTDPTQCIYDLGNSDENVSGKFKVFLKHIPVSNLLTLRKYAYSNILKISPLKTENFQIEILIFF